MNVNFIPKSLHDVTERAFWTFVEAYLAVFTVTDLSSAKTAAASGIAAALSVIKTFARQKLDR